MTNLEITKNRRALEHAIAQQKLEGLNVPVEALRDLDRVVRGEITTAEAIRAARARFVHAEIRQ